MAGYREICAEDYLTYSHKKKHISMKDYLFLSEAARKLFKKFQMFWVSSTDETSLCTVYRFDAVITLVFQAKRIEMVKSGTWR